MMEAQAIESRFCDMVIILCDGKYLLISFIHLSGIQTQQFIPQIFSPKAQISTGSLRASLILKLKPFVHRARCFAGLPNELPCD